MKARDEYTICTEIKNLIFQYFKPEFKKLFYHLIFTNNFSRYSIDAVLINDEIECLTNYQLDSAVIYENCKKDQSTIYELFQELKPIIVEKYGYWSSCYFYVNKDGSYELDFVCMKRGTEDAEETPPLFIQQKIDQINKGK